MNVKDVVDALDLPPESRVDQRVPKKLLVENGAPTAADKRQINEGIEELLWLATLKPNTIGVPEYHNETREYLEIAVLSLTLRPTAKATRVVELVHRAVPYPVLLICDQSGSLTVSMAHKRWSLGELGKIVLEDEVIGAELKNGGGIEPITIDTEKQFLNAISLTKQPRANLMVLYQGWIDALIALQATHLTGIFVLATTPEHATSRREALGECIRLKAQIASLRSAATKERQIARQVELNLEIKRCEGELTRSISKLNSEITE